MKLSLIYIFLLLKIIGVISFHDFFFLLLPFNLYLFFRIFGILVVSTFNCRFLNKCRHLVFSLYHSVRNSYLVLILKLLFSIFPNQNWYIIRFVTLKNKLHCTRTERVQNFKTFQYIPI